tara:strand:- start:328 stop:858 length:531 start_codon:yes stop_codon:yes gene_type:complete
MIENSEQDGDVCFSGAHIEMREVDGWEYVTRVGARGVVGVIAVTPENMLVLVEQFRPPLSARVLELPAGLVGDDREESFEDAARRELLEETGFEAETIEDLFVGPSSAGLTDEMVRIVRAGGLRRIHAGGGVSGESIVVHEVPIRQLDDFLGRFETTHGLIDFKVRLALHLVKGRS